MPVLHLFISEGRFTSEQEVNEYIQPSYNEDGDQIDSPFMKEIALSFFEPSCIETTFENYSIELCKILQGSSYEEQWVNKVPDNEKANVAIAVYEPNEVKKPNKSSLKYVGRYNYET